MDYSRIGIRWTVGDVGPPGFEALGLSLWGAWRLFGRDAQYVVFANSLPVEEAVTRTGHVPDVIAWRESGPLPQDLVPFVSRGMTGGTAWKLAPLRCFPDRYELSLDNDCILWDLPAALVAWLDDPNYSCLIAADVTLAHGAFTHLSGPQPRNTGIRGFPPHYDLGVALRTVLARNPVPLVSELDEQGLQVVALDLGRPAHVVSTADVSICAPFWPKSSHLGRCGAHFVGLNCRDVPWRYYGRPAIECIREHWERHRPALYERVERTPALRTRG
jgi:hypothetical protein